MAKYITKEKNVNDIKQDIKSALKKTSDIVCSTMGPGGRNVTIHSSGGIMTTKDGVTVTKYLNFDNPIDNLISMMAIDAATKTVKECGDGTTTTVLLYNALYNEVMSRISGNRNMFDVIKGIDMAVNDFREIVINESRSVYDENGINSKMLCDVSTISSNNDPIIGEMVSDAVRAVGANGVIDIRDSSKPETYFESFDGYVFNTIALKQFIPQGKSSITLHNPVYFIADMKFADYEELRDVVQIWNKNCKDADGKLRPLVMIVSDIEGSALSTMVVNSSKMPIVVIKAPAFGGHRYDMMSDIRLITNTRQVFSHINGYTLQRFGVGVEGYEELEFGSSKSITLSKDKAVIIRHNFVDNYKVEDSEMIEDGVVNIDNLVNELVEGLKNSLTEMESIHTGEAMLIRDRISRLSSGVGTIYVGGDSDLEVNYKKMVIDDAMRACFSALDGGVVKGGGHMYIDAYRKMRYQNIISKHNIDVSDGYISFCMALLYPIRKLMSNMYYNESDITNKVVALIDNENKYLDLINQDIKFNKNGNTQSLFDMGLIEPMKVQISATKNAASVCKQLLTTDWVLVLEDTKEMDLGKLFYPEAR